MERTRDLEAPVPSQAPEPPAGSSQGAQFSTTIVQPGGNSLGSAPPADAAALVDRYQIKRLVGHGAFGSVYEAWDPRLERLVAIKVLSGSAEGRDQILAEARSVAQVRHAAICPIYEVVDQSPRPFLVLAWLEGGTLAQKLNAAPLSVDDALDLVRRVALGMAHVHERGIIHRDLKPANILLDASGLPYVTDFGLSWRQPAATHKLHSAIPIAGTPAYMSPEQTMGDAGRLTAASDIFSLGAILYELLTRSRPFGGVTPSECVERVLHFDPPAPSVLCPAIPVDVDALVRKAIAKKPGERFSSMLEFATALQRVADSRRGVVPDDSGPTVVVPCSARLQARNRWARPVLLMAGIAASLLVAVGIYWRIEQSRARPDAAKTEDSTVDDTAKNSSNSRDTVEPAGETDSPQQPPATKPPLSGEQVDRVNREVAQWVVQRGGLVGLAGSDDPIGGSSPLPEGPIRLRSIDLSRSTRSQWELDKLRLDELGGLEELSLGACEVDARAAESIRGCDGLEQLALYSSQITLAELKVALGNASLRRLFLTNIPADENWLVAVCAAGPLEVISLGPLMIGEAGIVAINKSRISRLMLSRSQFSEQALRNFITNENITSLWLEQSNLSDEALGSVARLPALKMLDASSTAISDRGIAELSRCTSLQTLSLNKLSIGDGSIEHLNPLRNLQSLQIGETKITSAGLARLHLPRAWALTVDAAICEDQAIEALRKWPMLNSITLNGRASPELIDRLRGLRDGMRVENP